VSIRLKVDQRPRAGFQKRQIRRSFYQPVILEANQQGQLAVAPLGNSRSTDERVVENGQNGFSRRVYLGIGSIQKLAMCGRQGCNLVWYRREIRIAQHGVHQRSESRPGRPHTCAWKRFHGHFETNRRRLDSLARSQDLKPGLPAGRERLILVSRPFPVLPDSLASPIGGLGRQNIFLVEAERFWNIEAQAGRIPPNHAVLTSGG
jgi:hypothetical protein